MRIAVAMSGGVDSSVAALLLRREGADVVGLSMHLWNHDRDGTGSNAGRCCTLDDLSVARRAAAAIGVPHFVLNLEQRFTEAVVKPFVASYLEGKTPIPCTVCNTEVKFKTLLQKAAALGCEAVATGHYARIATDEVTGAPRLLRARDRSRDQSYFLYDLTEEQLSMRAFPARRADEARGAGNRARGGAAELGQARLAGSLLRAERDDARGLHSEGGRGPGHSASGNVGGAWPGKIFDERWRDPRSARRDVRLHDRPEKGAWRRLR